MADVTRSNPSDAGPTPKTQPAPARRERPQVRLRIRDLFGLALWLGLVAGFLELALLLARDPESNIRFLFRMSRHYLWMIPIGNALLFAALMVPLALLVWRWPRNGSRLALFSLGLLTLLPPLFMAIPWLFSAALVFLAGGIASWTVPSLARRPLWVGRVVRWSAPVLMLGWVGLFGFVFVRDWNRHAGAMTAPPAQGQPNVLLIVYDTVRADRLSLYDYERPTSPNLDRFADRGVAFTQARAPSPWTLPSHATMFTGRWLHELGVGSETPLDDRFATLAEFLSSQGFATAGFVGNTNYCASYTGLDRGFAHYQDYPTTVHQVLITIKLGDRLLDLADTIRATVAPNPAADPWRSYRKPAAEVNREFLDWLDRDRDRDRPFFAFLNYFDAHDPYIPPPSYTDYFGLRPQTDEEWKVLRHWWTWNGKKDLAPRLIQLARDGYDDCLGSLDDQFGRLLDDLERRGALENTIVLVTSDHGEHLGEHDLFGHGASLYDQEIRVPLVLVGPEGTGVPSGERLDASVNLRDLPVTILDLLGLENNAPFPGGSLATLWQAEADSGAGPSLSLAEMENPSVFYNANEGRSPAFRGPMKAIVDDQLFKYIVNGDGMEELYFLESDPEETLNLARGPQGTSLLGRFRQALESIFAPKD